MIFPMRFLATTLAVLALAGTAAGATRAPRLALVDTTPLTVIGSGFDGGSVVHVTVAYTSVRLTRKVEATRSGRFVARFRRSLAESSCTQVTIAAASARVRMTTKIVPAGDACGAQRATPDPSPRQ